MSSGLTLTQGRLIFLAFTAITLGVVGYSLLNSETGNPKARDAVHDAAAKAEKLAKEAADKVKAEAKTLKGKAEGKVESAKAASASATSKQAEVQIGGGEFVFILALAFAAVVLVMAYACACCDGGIVRGKHCRYEHHDGGALWLLREAHDPSSRNSLLTILSVHHLRC